MFKKMLLLVAVALALAGTAASQTLITPQLKKRALASITKDFKDPTSARLDDLFTTRNKGGDVVLCGTVTGKNSFGAYGDKLRFYYVDDRKDSFGAKEGDGLDMLFLTFCAESPAVTR